jgi:hypothetical protein
MYSERSPQSAVRSLHAVAIADRPGIRTQQSRVIGCM